MKSARTNVAAVGRKFEFLEDHLVTIALKCGWSTRSFSENEIGILRFTLCKDQLVVQ